VNNSDTLSLSGVDTEQDEPESGVGTPDQDLKGALHEVSNALTVVLGWLDVAGAKIALGEVKEAIVVARTHAKLGHSIAREAIGAKVIAGTSAERPAGDFAASALMAVRPQASRRGVQLLLEGETETTARIRSVSAALQILTNLLLNAIEFTPESEAVKLTVRSDEDNVYFEVSDSGPGIDPKRARTLFTAPESTRTGGAGIGLRHSEALARVKGAELTLVSAQPHAVVELRWPRAEAASGARCS
jgi:signal transduction histidine kinase